MSSGVLGELDVAVDRAALLGEAGHVDHAAALALEMRRHAEDRADGHDAGAADAGDDDRMKVLVERRDRRLGQRREASRRPSSRPAPPCARFAPCTVTKDGQKPFTQEKSLLQFDWSIWRLRPNSVSTRLHGDAVRLHAAIAAAFADQRR